MSTLYLAGPMRGLSEFNFRAFRGAAADLRDQGYDVWSPAEADVELDGFNPLTDEPRSLAEYMERDLPAVCKADAVVVLPGWEDSEGARLEVHVARACGKPVLSYPTLKPVSHPGSERFHEILAENGLLHDRKQADYGSDTDPFANVRRSADWGVPAWVGAMIRAGDKIGRLQSFVRNGHLANEGVEDSLRDLAVYSTIALVLFEEEEGA